MQYSSLWDLWELFAKEMGFLHFPSLYCMIVTNFLIVHFSFFILLLAPLQILILVRSTRSAKVASRCRDLNPGSSTCLAETLPLDQESLMISGINIAALNLYQIYITSKRSLQMPGIEPRSLCMLYRDVSPRPGGLDRNKESLL